MRRALGIALFAVLAPTLVEARPAESVDAERTAAAAALRDLDRRATTLDEQVGLRERMLRRRLRALYKMSQGGAFRLIVDAQTIDEVDQRTIAAERVVSRDLEEISALDDELTELAHDRARRKDELARGVGLEESTGPTTGLARFRGALTRPVQGPINLGLQRVRVREPRAGAPALDVPRRSVELSASSGERVRAIAAGTVRWVGELEGVGRAVIIDHGDRYVSVTGRLGRVHTRVGARVREGEVLGNAAGSMVSFELTEGKMPLDPARWLSPPVVAVVPAATPPSAAPPAKAATLAR